MGVLDINEDYDIANEPLTHEFLHDVLDFDLYLGRYTKRLNIANIRFPDHYSMMEWFELRKWNPGGYRFCMLNDINCTTKSINDVLKYPIKVYTIKDLFTEIQRVYDYIESNGFVIKEKIM